MDRQKIIIVGVLVAIAISAAVFTIPNSEQHVYIQSNITKANPNLVMGDGGYSMLEDFTKSEDVVLTVSGTVLYIDNVIDWTYEDQKYGFIPITIKVDEIGKNLENHLDLKKDDPFTFHLWGIYEINQLYINSYEPQFEIGEDVLLHIGSSDNGPDGPGGDNYYVELGMFGKYKVIEEKAYTEKYLTGRSLDNAFNESK